MSSLPFISHHLFVAAVDHERRDELTPPRNPADQESFSPQSLAMELPRREINLDRAVDWLSDSPTVTET